MIHIKHVDWGVIAGDVTKRANDRLTTINGKLPEFPIINPQT